MTTTLNGFTVNTLQAKDDYLSEFEEGNALLGQLEHRYMQMKVQGSYLNSTKVTIVSRESVGLVYGYKIISNGEADPVLRVILLEDMRTVDIPSSKIIQVTPLSSVVQKNIMARMVSLEEKKRQRIYAKKQIRVNTNYATLLSQQVTALSKLIEKDTVALERKLSEGVEWYEAPSHTNDDVFNYINDEMIKEGAEDNDSSRIIWNN